MHYVLEEVDWGWGVDWLATTTETYSIKGEIVGKRVGGNGKESDHMCSLLKIK